MVRTSNDHVKLAIAWRRHGGQARTEPVHSTTDTRFAVTRLGDRVVVTSMTQSGCPQEVFLSSGTSSFVKVSKSLTRTRNHI